MNETELRVETRHDPLPADQRHSAVEKLLACAGNDRRLRDWSPAKAACGPSGSRPPTRRHRRGALHLIAEDPLMPDHNFRIGQQVRYVGESDEELPRGTLGWVIGVTDTDVVVE